VILTGSEEYELLGTGMLMPYYDELLRIVSKAAIDEFITIERPAASVRPAQRQASTGPGPGLRPMPPYQLTSAGSGLDPVGPGGGRHRDTSTTPGSTSSSPRKASAANSAADRAWAGMPACR